MLMRHLFCLTQRSLYFPVEFPPDLSSLCRATPITGLISRSFSFLVYICVIVCLSSCSVRLFPSPRWTLFCSAIFCTRLKPARYSNTAVTNEAEPCPSFLSIGFQERPFGLLVISYPKSPVNCPSRDSCFTMFPPSIITVFVTRNSLQQFSSLWLFLFRLVYKCPVALVNCPPLDVQLHYFSLPSAEDLRKVIYISKDLNVSIFKSRINMRNLA